MAKLECDFCGHKIKPHEKFCPDCGKKLEEPQGEVPFVNQPPYGEITQESSPPPTIPPSLTGYGQPPAPGSAPGYQPLGGQPPGPVPPQAPPYQGGYHPPPVQGYSPVPDYALKKRSPVPVILGILLFVALVAVGVAAGFATSSRERTPPASGGNVNSLFEEFYRQQESGGEDVPNTDRFGTIVLNAQQELRSGDPGKALDIALELIGEHCDDPSYYASVASSMADYEQPVSAFRLYLLAYGITGEEGDLQTAFAAATPDQVIQREPLRQGISALFGKPMEAVTWQEIGQIKSYVHRSDSFQIGLVSRADVPAADYADTLFTIPIEGDNFLSLYPFYGLTDLSINISATDLERAGFSAMRRLRSLEVPSLTNGDLAPVSAAASVEELVVGGSRLTSLEGLERMGNVRSLTLERSGLTDLRELADCPRLEEVALVRNKEIASIAPLLELPGLRALSISGGEIGDFQLIANMGGLQKLVISDTEIKDVSFAFSLDLKHLELTSNSQLLSVSGLGGLTGLETLALSCAKLESGLNEIASLPGLRSLTLYSPASLSMVSGLDSLEELTLHGGGSLDTLAPVSSLSGLERFSMKGASSSINTSLYDYSLSPLAGLPGLRRVELQNLSVYTDCSALFTMSGLEYLDISGSDLSVSNYGTAFSGLGGLKTLKAGGARLLANVSIYSDGFFTSIDYDDKDMSTLAPQLSALASLERLEVRSSKLDSLAFAASLENLIYLDVADNYISDPAPLAGCTRLLYADLSDNPIYDISAIEREGLAIVR